MDSSEYILKSDYMVKRSQMKNWYSSKEDFKSRWFLLTNFSLKYFEIIPNSGIQNIKATIKLSSINIVANVDDDALGRANTFQVGYIEKEQYHSLYVIAQNEVQRKTWISTLRNACIAASAHFFHIYHPGALMSETKQFTCCYGNKNAKGCKLNPRSDEEQDDEKMFREIASEDYEIPSHELFTVLHDFEESDALGNKISIIQGEKVQLIEANDSYWWLIEKLDDKIRGYVPRDHLKKISIDHLDQFEWFLPSVTFGEIEKKLQDYGSIGCFLVSCLATDCSYTLALLTQKKNLLTLKKKPKENIVRHFKIKKDSIDMLYFSGSDIKFTCLPELISFYRMKKGGLGTLLTHPPRAEDLN